MKEQGAAGRPPHLRYAMPAGGSVTSGFQMSWPRRIVPEATKVDHNRRWVPDAVQWILKMPSFVTDRTSTSGRPPMRVVAFLFWRCAFALLLAAHAALLCRNISEAVQVQSTAASAALWSIA